MSESLPCEKIVYRLVSRKSDFIESDVQSSAFLRRNPKEDGTEPDKNGMSVNYDIDFPSQCAPRFNGRKLIVTLHVGRIKDSPYDLDAVATNRHHANIAGAPYPRDDELKAEQIAHALTDQARTVWRKGDPDIFDSNSPK